MTSRAFPRWIAAIALAFLTLFATLPARSQTQPPLRGEKYALLVGVHQYNPNELRSLPFTEADVVELAQVLKSLGYRQVVTLTQTAGASNSRLLPTAANIRLTLNGMLEDHEPGDTVLVAFAGHGIQFQNSPENYFCPMDTRLTDPTTLVSLTEVYKQLEACTAGVKLLMVDACRNDPQSDNSRARSVVKLESVTRPQQARPPGGVAALFSCSEGEKSFEHDRLKHGVFYHYVIQGLKGEADLDRDGIIDIEELARFTKRNVPEFVKEEYGFDVRQMPVMRGEISGLAALGGSLNGKVASLPEVRASEDHAARQEPASTGAEKIAMSPLPLVTNRTTPTATATPTNAPDRDLIRAMADGVQLYKQGKFAEARESFKEVEKAYPDDARVWYYAGLAQGSAFNDWKVESVRLILKGIEREKAGTPSRLEIDSYFADLENEVAGSWLAQYRRSMPTQAQIAEAQERERKQTEQDEELQQRRKAAANLATGHVLAAPFAPAELIPTSPRPRAEADSARAIPNDFRAEPGKIAVVPGPTITNHLGMRLVLIPAGEFLMGASEDQTRASDQKPRHPVRITRPFYLGAHEVTRAQFKQVIPTRQDRWLVDPTAANSDQLPADAVRWQEAITFCNELSKQEGLSLYYQFGSDARSSGSGYRLPTEAEWEYACRAGSETPFSFGGNVALLGDYSWYGSNSGHKVHPVGLKRPNPFGLHDMHGNAWEWCWDVYDAGYYRQSPPFDPPGPSSTGLRVSRGGSYASSTYSVTSSLRYGNVPETRLVGQGFRVARSKPPG